MVVVVVVAVLVGVVLAADRVAVVGAQARLAGRVQGWGFSARPRVIIAGFPFLTQLAAGRLTRVVVSAAGKKLGPVEVKQLDLRLDGVCGRGGGRMACRLSGTAVVGFAGLAGIPGTPGLTLAADGPDRVKISVGVGPVTGTATARVTRAGPGGIRIVVIGAGAIPVAVFGALRDVTVPLPALPAGAAIQEVRVTGSGVLVHIGGQNVRIASRRGRARPAGDATAP